MMRRRPVIVVLLAVVLAGCTGPLFEGRLVEVVAVDCVELETGPAALGGGLVGYPQDGVITGRSWTRVFPWVRGPVVAAVGEVISGRPGVDTRPQGYPCGDGHSDIRLTDVCAVVRDC